MPRIDHCHSVHETRSRSGKPDQTIRDARPRQRRARQLQPPAAAEVYKLGRARARLSGDRRAWPGELDDGCAAKIKDLMRLWQLALTVCSRPVTKERS